MSLTGRAQSRRESQTSRRDRADDETLLDKTIKKYLIDQRTFFGDPRRFVQRVRPKLRASVSRPVIYLLGACAGVLAAGQVNLNLYDERITRAYSLPDLITGQASALISALTLALAVYATLKIVRARVSVREVVGSIVYAIAFVLPLLTAVFIVATRIASPAAGVTILFLPPTRIVELGVPESTWIGSFAMALILTVQVGWNVYMVWLIWQLVQALNSGISAARTAAAVVAGVITMYSISGLVDAAVGPIIRVFKPVLEHLLKG